MTRQKNVKSNSNICKSFESNEKCIMTGAYFGTHEIITQLFSNDESKKIN
jgi:hypothetical protein